jgi:hypothetical protein
MLDLYNIKYDQYTLKKYIYAISLIDILKTQIIDADFAVKYVLQRKYQITKEESIITPNMVLYFQPHIKEDELLDKLSNYDSDNDSFHF